MEQNETNNDDKINIEKMMLLQKSLAIMVKQKEESIKNLQKQIDDKDKEITKLKDINKSIEKKSDEIFQFSTKVNISDIKELKHQFDSDKLVLSEMIKTLQKDITKKNKLIEQLNKELDFSRSELELQRKLNIKYFDLNSPLKLNSEKIKVEFQKVSCENTAIKAKTLDLEEKIEILITENERLKSEKELMEKNLEDSQINSKNVFDKMKNSYDKLIKNLLKMSTSYHESSKKITELSKIKINNEKEIKELNKKNMEIEKENISLKSENDGFRKRIQTHEYQINSLKNEIKEMEKTMAENKFSKRVFYVSYTYLSMPMNGNITIEKDITGNFNFIIENRTATRKLSFLDVDVTVDPNYKNKIIVNFLKDNTQEEYTTSEAKVLVDTFNEFKKRVIEVSDVGSDTKSIHENDEKVNKAQQKINNFFGMI